ncbi:PspC domain-containing protein [Macrococcoides canis]|uniref:PspC domain-containing protein n=1 Tax=Macrococcoides canis TaxID=1855823 RepID=A0A4R6C731_9STAP|nr:PspC domain-containing protein [Macrococcus canis]MEE1107744.1 PspC domain-containing protein [Macrococcus canis]TDM18169.1 PspC domain-containing protein [Macrococcus canis]TDM21778.1 PspC domain-containing protein [Macrococcus canis]TDM24276.1 PspC domain-containing protein [Macrococcus canis]TDM32766.1 PspC domain-containing protein [Macrococcus canis]
MERRLAKSTTDRYVAGVLGGLSEYFNIDSTVVRVIFILVSFLTANIPTFTIYILLAIFMPKDTDILDNY